jgi:hypothetical protein
LADQPCDLKTHSIRPQNGSCVPVPFDAEPLAGFRAAITLQTIRA